jgi:hypothetical protein
VKEVELCKNVKKVYEENGNRKEWKKEDKGKGDCDERNG